MLIAVWLMAAIIVALLGVIVWQRLVIRVIARVARDAGANAAAVDQLAGTILKGSN